MTIYTTGDRIRPFKYLEEFESTPDEVLGATAEESFLRSASTTIARHVFGAPEFPSDAQFELMARQSGRPVEDLRDELEAANPLLSAAEARRQTKESGVELDIPEEGIRRAPFTLLLQRKLEERRRLEILDRSPSGIGMMFARLGVGLGVQLLDPINIASAFIPIVGPTRYAAMLSRAGGGLARAGVRLRVGAAEGAVGAALVEPIVLAGAIAEQADYDFADSLLNIAFGTVLGGGLHVGAGWVGDLARPGRWQTYRPTEGMPAILDRIDPKTRETALRLAVAQAAEGRTVEIASLIDAFRPVAIERIGALERRLLRLQEQNIGGRFNAEIEAARIELVPFRQLEDMQRTIGVMRQNNIGGRFNQQIAELERASDELIGDIVARPEALRGEAVRLESLKSARQTQAAHEAELMRLLTKEQPQIAARLKEAKRRRDLGEVDIRAERRQIRQTIEQQRRHVAVSREAVEETAAGGLEPIDIPRAELLRRIGEVERGSRPAAALPIARTQQETIRIADDAAARDADARLAIAPKTEDVRAAEAELADAMQTAQDIARTFGDEEAVTRELTPFDELIATAESYAKAVKAAAVCLLRRG